MTRWGIGLAGASVIAAAAVIDCVGDDTSNTVDGGADATTEGGACTVRSVNDTTGVYVSINGADSATCGARTAPCQTIQAGIDQAKLLARSTVYIARGTYVESLTLASGISLEGGWDTLSAQWVPICGSDEISAVKVKMPDASHVVATADFSGATTLRLMSLLGKTTAAPGESVYGVIAHNAHVTLESVVVTLGNGGAGLDADAGASGSDGGTNCAPSDAGAGAPAANGTGALPGSFSDKGYQPSNGQPGSSDGGNGNAGSCGLSIACDTLCNAKQCGTGCSHSLGGCGGGPGSGGGGGSGGGSSIALYGWNATFTFVGGAFTAGNGGNGGNGGGGGVGGNGGAGNAEQELCLTCINADGGYACATVGDTTLASGTQGGVGGAGGHGGGGAGGSSYAVFNGGDAGAVVVQSAPTLVHGTAGAGGSVNGAAGQAANQAP